MKQARKTPSGKEILTKHPFGLGKYYLINILVYSVLTVGTLYWNRLFEEISFWWILSLIPLFLSRFRYIAGGSILLSIIVFAVYGKDISWYYLILLPIAIYVGHLSAVFIHNAVHYNFRPRWSNPIIGELCALQQLSAGFPVFRLVHDQHHSHSDDPTKDPHPPKGHSFWEYVDASRSMIMNRLRTIYIEKWGETEQVNKNWKIQMGLLLCSRFMKTLFWFALLGPKGFVLLFLPSYLANVFLFAAFNYFTHIEREDGTTEILNLDSNWYFKICNRTLFGVMYHKNHHLSPKLFNPINMKPKAV